MKRLMVVDDEFIVRVGIRSMVQWEEYGYTMADASSGEEALEKIARCRPDIVLTDLKMENMDGFELIRRCAVQFPSVRFVVLSSYNDFDNIRKAMKLGARDYIFKLTVKPEELIKTLDEIDKDAQPELDRLGELIRENFSAIKYNLFCKSVSGNNEEEILSRFKSLNLGVDILKPYRILYIVIDDFEGMYLSGEFRNLPMIKSSMENIIGELIGKEYKMETFNREKGDLAVLINTVCGETGLPFEENAGKAPVGFVEEFSRLQDYIRRYLGLTISGVISPEIVGIEDLPSVIRICEESLLHRNGPSRLCPYTGGLRNEIIRAKEFIDAHPSEKLGVSETAAHIGMSESYFSHLFKKETGINFIDYVNRSKMEKAAALLENSTMKIADVAGQVGIENSNYFSVVFKKCMGCTPQEYRSAYKKQK